MSHPREYPLSIEKTEPEVFIIESISVDDEIDEIFEGRALRDSLRIAFQRPAYYYVRTATQLDEALELFRHSGYRFLHLSLHGSSDSVFTALEEIPNADFAALCVRKLRNRRIFFSACEVGSGGLHELLSEENRGMYSIASPVNRVSFGVACAFWTSFYVKALKLKRRGMNADKLKPVFTQLCAFFDLQLRWSY